MEKKLKNKESILVICLGFLGLFFLTKNPVFSYIAMGVGVLSLLSEKLENLIALIWFKTGHILGLINSTIILSVLFYLLVVPLAILKKLTSKPTVILKKGGKSYFVERNHQYSKKDMENVW